MNNILEYKGYYGTVEFSYKDNILVGQVIGMNHLVSFKGDSVQSLKKSFEDAVDAYLEKCEQNGEEPEKVYRGSFNVRISSELHKRLALYSAACGQTLNSTVEEAIKTYVQG